MKESDAAPQGLLPFVFAGLFLVFTVFTYLIYTQSGETAPAAPLMSQQADEGRLVFQKYNCQACHQFYGLGGYLGPDLTNASSRPGKGDNYLRAILRTGIGQMPNFNLSENEIDALSAFLKYTDQTGYFPGPFPNLTWYGSFVPVPRYQSVDGPSPQKELP